MTLPDTLPTTEQEWLECLADEKAAAQAGGVLITIKLGRMVYGFHEFCTKTQGGTNFTAKATACLGMDKPAVSRLSAIGFRADELLEHINCLPNASAVGLIAPLPGNEFRKVLDTVNPDMTVKEVRDLIREVKGLPAPERRSPTIIEGEVIQHDDGAVIRERFLKGQLNKAQEEIEALKRELGRKAKAAPVSEPVVNNEVEILRNALANKDRDIAKVVSERDEAVAKAAALEMQIAALTVQKNPAKPRKLPTEGTFTARDLLDSERPKPGRARKTAKAA